jgi:5-methylcytosine-specific restriction protein A
MPKRLEFHRPKRPSMRKKGPSFHQKYGPEWEEIRLRVLLRDNWQCQHCGRVCGDKWEAQVDHKIPLKASGSHSEDNLQTLCIRCHLRKTQAGM